MGYRPKVSNFAYGVGLGKKFNPGVQGRIKKTSNGLSVSHNMGIPNVQVGHYTSPINNSPTKTSMMNRSHL